MRYASIVLALTVVSLRLTRVEIEAGYLVVGAPSERCQTPPKVSGCWAVKGDFVVPRARWLALIGWSVAS